jgi:hypothetical protein
MTYRIAYGVETETLIDPDELVLLDLPEECADMDSEELESWIRGNWGEISIGVNGLSSQPMVGFQDVLDSIRLILPTVPGITDTDSAEETILESLFDAFDNN